MDKPTLKTSYEDLILRINGSSGSGTRQFDTTKAILDAKIAIQSAEQARQLKVATWVLVLATVGLVIATGVLILAT